MIRADVTLRPIRAGRVAARGRTLPPVTADHLTADQALDAWRATCAELGYRVALCETSVVGEIARRHDFGEPQPLFAGDYDIEALSAAGDLAVPAEAILAVTRRIKIGEGERLGRYGPEWGSLYETRVLAVICAAVVTA